MKVIDETKVIGAKPIVYVIQEIAGTKAGNPKINIIGASHYGKFKFLLPEFSQMIFSPGPLIYKLRKSKDGWKIVNIIINGVNLGLTFRNQFQALAVSHNENISDTLRNWVSDAGTAGIT